MEPPQLRRQCRSGKPRHARPAGASLHDGKFLPREEMKRLTLRACIDLTCVGRAPSPAAFDPAFDFDLGTLSEGPSIPSKSAAKAILRRRARAPALHPLQLAAGCWEGCDSSGGASLRAFFKSACSSSSSVMGSSAAHSSSCATSSVVCNRTPDLMSSANATLKSPG